jgi:hypothetical protein
MPAGDPAPDTTDHVSLLSLAADAADAQKLAA